MARGEADDPFYHRAGYDGFATTVASGVFLSRMVTILFWNIKGVHKRSPLPQTHERYTRLVAALQDAVTRHSVDILVLAESPFAGTLTIDGFVRAETALKPNQSTKVETELYFRTATVKLTQYSALARTAYQRVTVAQTGQNFLLVATHLSAIARADAEGKRRNDVATMVRETVRVEAKLLEESGGADRKTVIIGDFNYDPFDAVMTDATHCHAVPDRAIAKAVARKSEGNSYSYFYNPMWQHLGDRANSPAGTYYFEPKNNNSRHWHTLDQVLLRPDMLDHWRDDYLEIVGKIGTHDLTGAGNIPDAANYSDHLPLLLRLDI